ncbi:hypothetical protein PM082_015242 [Marasmius tenuissimus]|nr:hypothetical protein PM082_015242 [Marasmius tenuissimus]
MASYFSNARWTKIGANATIQTVAGDAITNIYNNAESADRVTLYGRTVRRIIEGDIKLRHQLSSKVLTVNVDSQRGGSTSEPGLRAVKVNQRAKDSIFRRCLRSKILSIVSKPREGLSTSRASPGSSQVIKVKKTEHTAEIHGHAGLFTVTTLEPIDENDRDKFDEIANGYLEAVMSWRRVGELPICH